MSNTDHPNENPNANSENRLLYIFTRTPLHVGAGTSVGALDQPIQRERPTGFPIIPGSSLKGVLRFAAERDQQIGEDKAKEIFGDENNAGLVALGEGRILAFPVRSARGSFAFISCPLALERLRRENTDLAGLAVPTEPSEMRCLAGEAVTIVRGGSKGIVLEEYRFGLDAPFPSDWQESLLFLLKDDAVWQTGRNRFVLLSNGDFSHFVRNACEVNQHVRISDEKGTAEKGGLFDLEAVPAETLFFAPITSLPRPGTEAKAIAQVEGLLDRKPVLQLGGDSTTGLGFCTVKLA